MEFIGKCPDIRNYKNDIVQQSEHKITIEALPLEVVHKILCTFNDIDILPFRLVEKKWYYLTDDIIKRRWYSQIQSLTDIILQKYPHEQEVVEPIKSVNIGQSTIRSIYTLKEQTYSFFITKKIKEITNIKDPNEQKTAIHSLIHNIVRDKVVDIAIKSAQKNNSTFYKSIETDFLPKVLVEMVLAGGSIEKIIKLTAKEALNTQWYILKKTAKMLISRDHIDFALNIGHSMPEDNEEKPRFFQRMAKKLVDINNIDQAIKVADIIPRNNFCYGYSILHIIKTLVKNGQNDTAQNLYKTIPKEQSMTQYHAYCCIPNNRK